MHRVQAGGGARFEKILSFGDVSGSVSGLEKDSGVAERMSTVRGFSAGVRAIIVEFVKQVHLQKVGGAAIVSSAHEVKYSEYVLEAEAMDINAQIAENRAI